MNYLYEIMKDYDFIKTTLSELKKNVKYTSMCVDDSYVFLLLFSYDFFQDFIFVYANYIILVVYLQQHKKHFYIILNY